jgi:uncharacterized protein (TIGR02594 family)
VTRSAPTSALEVATRLIGTRERPGIEDDPFIRWCHSICAGGEAPDEVPWCSSFANGVAYLLGLPRSASKGARSWLAIGAEVNPLLAEPGFDVVILSRGADPQPPATVLNAPGHVGFFAGWNGASAGAVMLVGGNQGDAVTRAAFDRKRILGIRRLA